ncbi:FAD-linked oxidoreductase-like protein [Coniochaeta sp. 2T2.1]|nr:FAD-linked oxidoreductase-like protein [Coniochaeta sp. 2T2.1]
MPPLPSPLAVLPFTTVVRSLLTTTISSSPWLLPPSMAAMSAMAHSTNPVLNPDRNPILKFLLKKTFYAQYCAGENAVEVRQTVDSLKRIGFSGVILGYAREVVLPPEQTADLASCGEGAAAEECIKNEINPWAAGTVETVLLASPGDYVALKFTGAGRQALHTLFARLPPSPPLASAIDSICDLAASRGVRLLFDAEQQAVQAGIDDWTLAYMRRYNRSAGRTVVYGTYQTYLKATSATLSKHLAAAREGGFSLGVKLVRGAYLGSDPRGLIHDTKADTDAAYDGIAAALLRREWRGPLVRPDGVDGDAFPEVSVVLASHNRESVLKARAILDAGEGKGTGRTEVAFAQLQGMADEVSCELSAVAGDELTQSRIKAYKYLVWGSTGECMKYLLRRAHENRDAVERTRSGRDAMRAELWRRVRGVFGFA